MSVGFRNTVGSQWRLLSGKWHDGIYLLKDYSGSYLENMLEDARMETNYCRDPEKMIMTWTRVNGKNTDWETF